MIKVSVLYPNSDGKKFDMTYYLNRHIPMVQQKFGAACKGTQLDVGVSGGQPGSKPPFVAMVHFLFDSAEAFGKVMAPNAEAIMGDIPNYTDIQPVIQIGEVKI